MCHCFKGKVFVLLNNGLNKTNNSVVFLLRRWNILKCHNGGHFLLRVGGRERPFPHARWLTPPPHPHRRGTDLCRIESDNNSPLEKKGDGRLGARANPFFLNLDAHFVFLADMSDAVICP